MTEQRYRLVTGRVDPSGQIRTWKLLDLRGKVRAEMTCKEDVGTVIAALNLAHILTANCAKVGLCIEQQARYQHAEDEFNEF